MLVVNEGVQYWESIHRLLMKNAGRMAVYFSQCLRQISFLKINLNVILFKVKTCTIPIPLLLI